MLYSRAVEIQCSLHTFTGDLNQQGSHGLCILNAAVLAAVFFFVLFHMFLHETRPTYKSAVVRMFLEDTAIAALHTRRCVHTAGLIKQQYLCGGGGSQLTMNLENCTHFTWISFHQILIG